MVGRRRSNIRWWQKGGAGSSFAIDDVHIGPPCRKSCTDDDKCVIAFCQCDKRFNGKRFNGKCLSSVAVVLMINVSQMWQALFVNISRRLIYLILLSCLSEDIFITTDYEADRFCELSPVHTYCTSTYTYVSVHQRTARRQRRRAVCDWLVLVSVIVATT